MEGPWLKVGESWNSFKIFPSAMSHWWHSCFPPTNYGSALKVLVFVEMLWTHLSEIIGTTWDTLQEFVTRGLNTSSMYLQVCNKRALHFFSLAPKLSDKRVLLIMASIFTLLVSLLARYSLQVPCGRHQRLRSRALVWGQRFQNLSGRFPGRAFHRQDLESRRRRSRHLGVAGRHRRRHHRVFGLPGKT